jgi:hypothetical protein
MARFPIAYDAPMRLLMRSLGLGPAGAWVEVDELSVEVRMGWAFRARFPRGAVRVAERSDRRVISQGVHGRNGRWLVNGARRGLVRIDLAPDQDARAIGRRVRLSTLEVGVEDPGALVAALTAPASGPTSQPR